MIGVFAVIEVLRSEKGRLADTFKRKESHVISFSRFFCKPQFSASFHKFGYVCLELETKHFHLCYVASYFAEL